MMRGLAEFIMRGRWQARGRRLRIRSLLFGWISAAAIALVTLRGNSRRRLAGLVGAARNGYYRDDGRHGTVMLLAGSFRLAVVLREPSICL